MCNLLAAFGVGRAASACILLATCFPPWIALLSSSDRQGAFLAGQGLFGTSFCLASLSTRTYFWLHEDPALLKDPMPNALITHLVANFVVAAVVAAVCVVTTLAVRKERKSTKLHPLFELSLTELVGPLDNVLFLLAAASAHSIVTWRIMTAIHTSEPLLTQWGLDRQPPVTILQQRVMFEWILLVAWLFFPVTPAICAGFAQSRKPQTQPEL
ncbi:hypothetical protein DFJ73DRAFT_839246 [Zopfochytrium polystomum]|nr:hypothetical protein DFJ73DRAFT_839246 [Zopfochytrium polystomum]